MVVLASVENAERVAGKGSALPRAKNWLREKLGIDKAIAFTVLGRGWASCAGLVTVALIARFLSPAEQGYYYTFGSLIALQIVFELGFSFVIMQLASHERAHLTIGPGFAITGNEAAQARLASILQKAVRWYSMAAALLATFLLVAGSHFFAAYRGTGQHVSWHIPWYADALAAALTFQLDPIISFLEGCGFVANVARVRFVQAVVGSVLAWIALAIHHGLFAPAMIIGGNATVAVIWLFRYRRLLLPLLWHKPGLHRIRWMQEVFPFQWRIAVSWLCGYFIFQLYNPVLFAYHGAVVAGQMGMSLSLANALTTIAVSWVNTKAAPFGSLIARREFDQLDRLFFKSLRQALVVCGAGAVVVWLGAICLNWGRFPFIHRILGPTALGILLLNATINVVIFAQATYLRAHKEEKFLLNSVVGAILVGSSTFFLGKALGAIGVVTGTLLTSVLIGLPWSTYIFVRYRRIWHGC